MTSVDGESSITVLVAWHIGGFLHEANYIAQLIYLMICVGLSDVPLEVYIHVMAFMIIADVILMYETFPPALPISVTDYAIARNVLMSATSCLCLRR